MRNGVTLLLLILLLTGTISHATTNYDQGNPTLADIWVDPVSGSDANSGASVNEAVRTLTRAWALVPAVATTTGYRINLLPGTFACEPGPEAENCINYFSDRTGTYQFPVIIQAVNGPGTVTIRGGLNINRVHYLYLIDLGMTGGGALPTNSSGNNLLHLSESDHVLLRRLTLSGPDCANDSCNNLQEVLKVNQAQYIYVEDSTIGGAWHSSVDFMVVQYGHVLKNTLHTAGQWCMYAKGGSAYLTIEGNELHDCQLGFEAGQSANFAMMVPPWLHYDVYDIKFVNNLLRDIPGVGMAVAGGYNILFANNTLYRVGISTEPGYQLVNVQHGERNCTPTDDLLNPVPTCNAMISSGGWGPDFQTDGSIVVPNRNVYVYNNIFYNPAPTRTLYSHFGVNGPLTPPAGFRNFPTPARTDDNLVIKGNLVWNGTPDMPLGIEESDQGCQSGNPACNEAQLRANNAINTIEPQFVDAAHGNFHPLSGGNLFGVTTYPIPAFSWSDIPPSPVVPAGALNNAIATDRDGIANDSAGPPGAYRTSAGTPIPVTRVDGACGSGTAAASVAPATNLCSSGTATAVTGSGPWNWSCGGSNGGTTASCTAAVATLPPTGFTVTPATGSGFTIVPSTPQTINSTAVTTFTITPVSGYGIVSVSGCSGSLSGTAYTIAPVSANCTITVTAVARNAANGTSGPAVGDALKVFQAAAGITQLTAADLIRYDVAPLGGSGIPEGNGVIDAADVILILRRSIGIGSW